MTPLITPGVCRVCGCSEPFACESGCAWADAERTLCSRCAAADSALAVGAGLRRMAQILEARGGRAGPVALAGGPEEEGKR